MRYNPGYRHVERLGNVHQRFAIRQDRQHELIHQLAVRAAVTAGFDARWQRRALDRRQIRLHRLVWIAANGIPPEGMVVAHQNNDKTDNRIANLRLITASENSTDAAEDGLYHTGLANPATKLAPELHQQICDDYRQGGITMRQLGERYGISKSRIHQIVTESGWTDGQSDSARYRQLGNAVCVNVAEWIGRRIMEAQL